MPGVSTYAYYSMISIWRQKVSKSDVSALSVIKSAAQVQVGMPVLGIMIECPCLWFLDEEFHPICTRLLQPIYYGMAGELASMGSRTRCWLRRGKLLKAGARLERKERKE
ncbi:unnamed protein product (mitochondrion) [Musa textilis]